MMLPGWGNQRARVCWHWVKGEGKCNRDVGCNSWRGEVLSAKRLSEEEYTFRGGRQFVQGCTLMGSNKGGWRMHFGMYIWVSSRGKVEGYNIATESGERVLRKDRQGQQI